MGEIIKFPKLQSTDPIELIICNENKEEFIKILSIGIFAALAYKPTEFVELLSRILETSMEESEDI